MGSNVKKLITLLLAISVSQIAYGDDCVGWFLRSGLVMKSDDCEVKCSVTPVDMSAFSCPSKCEELCEKNIVDTILEYTPRLTEGDRVAIKRYPIDAIQVYKAKSKVDSLTEKIFGRAGKGDETDAFRHFVWSSLLSRDLGSKKAKFFLDAHEQDSTQTAVDKKMDEFNNQKGIEFVQSNKSKKVDLDVIEKEALFLLRQGKLKVNEKKLETIPRGYYSR